MNKVLLSLVLVGMVSTAYATDMTITAGSSRARMVPATGSFVRLAVQDNAPGFGLEGDTVRNVTRNQADINYTLINYAGFTAKAGLGVVSKTGVQTHAVYLGKVGFQHNYESKWNANVGLAYRNDFSKTITDRKTTFSVGTGYAFNDKNTLGATFERGYGDSKTDRVLVSYNTKF